MRLQILLAVLTAAALAAPASASALPAHEWGTPAGHAHGVMLVVHGGSWQGGRERMDSIRPLADFYRARGWRTLLVDYRSGAKSIDDVVRLYDYARRQVGRNTPICAAGQSAGGNLAMALATIRPRLACVISEEGPANLMPLRDGHTAVPYITEVLRSFTAGQSRRMSPALNLGRYHGRILASLSTADTFIPGAVQARALRNASTSAQVDVVMMPAAVALDVKPFIHFSTTRAALRHWRTAQTALLRAVSRAAD